jgi:DNA topoisomerase-1
MSKSLVIVESPSKAKTINKYLGSNYKVVASVGHIKDLPKNGLGIDLDREFEPTYETIPGKEKVIDSLKSAARSADEIYVATDPDREGEAIGWHVKEIIEGASGKPKPVRRILFNEITKPAIIEAMKHPGSIDENLVNAQQARRLLDRIVGYQVSPLLWDKVRRGLSAGRVQSVAVRLVVEREREINAFVSTEYWSIVANLGAALPPAFDAKLVRIGEQTVKLSGFDKDLRKSEVHIKDAQQAHAIVAELERAAFTVAEVATKEKKRNPVPPFITSKLQQEASRKLRFPVKKTMRVAQKLYEGVDLGEEGTVGLITYMRTDSTRVADSAISEARGYVKGAYGPQYLPEKPNFYRSKKGAQDAHEAIRPTGVDRTPERMARFLSADELALYRLIWQRFLASQMMPAVFDQTTIDIAAGERYTFRATGSVLKFDGFLAVYEEGKDEKDEEDEERAVSLPRVATGERLALNTLRPNQHFTEPPPRYSEATLVKALEEKGIGRPSTYAQIMTVIQEREYVEKVQGRFRPTELGEIVNDLLIGSFDDIFNAEYTASLEEQLDEIEDGKVEWRDALKGFYEKFSRDLEHARHNMVNIKRQEVLTDEECEKCGSKMAKKFGRFGSFLACSNYPECKNTRDLAKPSDPAAAPAGEAEAAENPFEGETCENCGKAMQLKRGRFGQFLACTGYPECKTTRKIMKSGQAAQPDRPLEEECPKCGKNLVLKHGRYGEFIACSNYPKCKHIKQETVGLPCPKCGKGDIAVKKSKRGRVFYGCTEYPGCDFTSWDKPVDRTCPACGANYLVEKTNSKGETVHACANKECKFKETVGTPEPVAGDRAGVRA